jgi:hypothetical protein
MSDVFLIALIAWAVLRATRRSLADGFPFAAALLVLLPGQLCVDLPGALPEITVHRVILAILAIRWGQAPAPGPAPTQLGQRLAFALLLVSRVISDALSVTPIASLKDLLAFSLETVFYFQLARFALAAPDAGRKTLRAVTISLAVVAGIAFVERYWAVSLPLLAIPNFKYLGDGIQSSYPHRILLGYAMAMGTPLALLMLDEAATPAARRAWWLVLGAVIGACFFADSRGGWIGMSLGGVLSFVTGSRRTRRRCLAIAALAALTVLVRPGIRETIVSRIEDTYAQDSYKAVSYRYRWLLWHVSFSEVERSPIRLLFGYGGLSTESMDLSQYFLAEEGGTTGKIGFTSWDNHYASDLMEFGLLGLTLELSLYAAFVLHLLRNWRGASVEARPVIQTTLVASMILMFARTNVYIFGEPLRFLFWTIVAVGTRAAQIRSRAIPASEEKSPLGRPQAFPA